jgi:hypothetical protein
LVPRIEEAGQHVFRRPGRLSLDEGHEDHLVAAARGAILLPLQRQRRARRGSLDGLG